MGQIVKSIRAFDSVHVALKSSYFNSMWSGYLTDYILKYNDNVVKWKHFPSSEVAKISAHISLAL